MYKRLKNKKLEKRKKMVLQAFMSTWAQFINLQTYVTLSNILSFEHTLLYSGKQNRIKQV